MGQRKGGQGSAGLRVAGAIGALRILDGQIAGGCGGRSSMPLSSELVERGSASAAPPAEAGT
jgi:hypothetical protein